MTYVISSDEIIENAEETYRTRWEVGDMVVVHALNDLDNWSLTERECFSLF